ncbi:MAG: MmcQ/YjbR family DNA-binding protein [Flaviaesturariibacter sp.]|nr:MmcQ/YjbR family DNA-binding protein [Flaviaesturariibacter sp.]
MVTIKTFIELALGFDNAVEQPHFDKPSYRLKKKIFATLDIKGKRAVLKLTPIEQSVFCSFDPAVIYPVSGSWGKQGWTAVELRKVRKAMLADALRTAYECVSMKAKAG